MRLIKAAKNSTNDSQIDLQRVPAHIAVIMDGNGRWAKRRGLPRAAGHRAGVSALRRAVEACQEIGVKALTVYAFSTENWERPKSEVSFLLHLLEDVFEKEIRDLHANGVQVKVLGRKTGLPESTLERIAKAEALTAVNTSFRLNIAFNYGGRADLVDACKSLCRLAVAGKIDPESIDETNLAQHLSTASQPDPDLLIRTGGDMRISNFLLWEIAYSELYVTSIFWPDFGPDHLYRAIAAYQGRERRFGRL